MLLLGGIMFLIWGLFMIVSPVTFYRLTESWKHDGADEPSALYQASTRFGGVMITIVGLAGIVAFFVG